MRAALYARFSSDNQNPRSIEDQLAQCRAHAVREGWRVVHEYADFALSATSMDRPDVQRMIADAEAGHFEVIVTESLSRMSRNLGDTARLREELEFHGVRIHTLSSGLVTDMHAAFEGLKNSQALKDLGDALRRQHKGAVDRGLTPAGLGYGYDAVKDVLDAKGEIVRGLRRVNEAEAAIVRRIFAEYTAGVSPFEIVRRLNAEGVPAPGARTGRGSGHWTVSTIVGNRARGIGILHCRTYIGEIVYNKSHKVRHPQTRKRIIRTNPQSEWKVQAAPELRVVTDEAWTAAQAIKSDHGGDTLRTVKHRAKHLFSGIVACGVCNGSYIVRDSKRLSCSAHQQKATCDNARTIKRVDLEARILAKLKILMARPAAIAAYVKEYHEAMRERQTKDAAHHREAEKRIRTNREKIARLVAAIEDGGDGKALAKRVAELEAETRALEAQAAAGQAPVIQLYPDAHQMYARKMDELQDALTRDTLDRTHAMNAIRGLIDRIVLRPDATQPNGLAIEVEGRLQGFLELANQHGNGPRTPHIPVLVPMVPRAGIEPATQGFSIPCSTN